MILILVRFFLESDVFRSLSVFVRFEVRLVLGRFFCFGFRCDFVIGDAGVVLFFSLFLLLDEERLLTLIVCLFFLIVGAGTEFCSFWLSFSVICLDIGSIFFLGGLYVGLASDGFYFKYYIIDLRR